MNKLLLTVLIFLFTLPCFSQFTEGFEGTTGPDALPSTNWTLGSGNWAVFDNGVGFSENWRLNNSPDYVYQGTNAAYVSREGIGALNTSEEYLATPPVFIPANGRLRFFSRTFTAGNQGTLYQIRISPATAAQADPAAYTLVQQWTEDEMNSTFNEYEEKVVDLSAFAGFLLHIAFVKVYTQPDFSLGGDRWFIDNVSVEQPNGCNRPMNMHANFTSYTTLNFNWTNDGHPSWEVMVLPCSSSPTATDVGTIVTTNSFVFTGLIPNTCYTTYIRTTCPDGSLSSWYSITPHPPVNGKFVLNAFIDANNNGVRDSGEGSFVHGDFTSLMNNTGSTTYFTTSSGSYTFTLPVPLAVYDFGYQIDTAYAPYFALGTFSFDDIPTPAIGQTVTLNFPILQTLDYPDTEVHINLFNEPVAGYSDIDYLYLYNYSLSAPSTGTLTYTKAPNTTISSVIPSTNVTLTPTGFTYPFSLAQSSGISLTVNTDIPPIPTVNIGDILQSSAIISVSGSDTFPSNNSFNINQTVLGAFDPNEISESHSGKIVHSTFTVNDFLYYTIHFQNTGTANTSTIRVEDLLDSRIDESTISMVGSSHNYTLQRTNSSLIWNFNNIALTPAATNLAQSQGYIQYKVKLKPGFAIGDIIPNTASIYFDTNPAIVTTIFNTEFVETLGNPTFNANTISLYPNPTSDMVTISNSNANDKIASVVIYEVSGKRIYTLNKDPFNNIGIDVSHFAKGIYLVELTSESNSKITKKLLLK